jgi:hypothetical protein
MKIDDNIDVSAAGDSTCAHCQALLARAGEPHLARALVRDVDPAELGPQVKVPPARYTPTTVTARLSFCPGCMTQLSVSVGPLPNGYRSRTIAVRSAHQP